MESLLSVNYYLNLFLGLANETGQANLSYIYPNIPLYVMY